MANAPRIGKFSSSAVVQWGDGSLFDGFLLVGFSRPTLAAAEMDVRLGNYGEPAEPLPQFYKIPIVAGAYSQNAGLFFNEDLNPRNTKYYAWLYTGREQAVAGPSASFAVTSEVITAPTFTVPTPAEGSAPTPDVSGNTTTVPISTYVLTGDVDADGYDIVNLGNVGIGIDTPESTLDVVGTSNFLSSGTGTFACTAVIENDNAAAAVAAGILRVLAVNDSSSNALLISGGTSGYGLSVWANGLNQISMPAPTAGSSGAQQTGMSLGLSDGGNAINLEHVAHRTSTSSGHGAIENRVRRRVDGNAMGYVGFGSTYVSVGHTTNTELARFDSTGVLFLRPQNSGIGEGGELSLDDPTGSESWRIDNNNGTLRFFRPAAGELMSITAAGRIKVVSSLPTYANDAAAAAAGLTAGQIYSTATGELRIKL